MRADVVIAANDLVAQTDSGQDHKRNQNPDDRHPTPRGAGHRRLGFGHHLLGHRGPRIDHRSPPGGGVGWREVVVGAGYRARQDRLGLPGIVVLHHVGHHDGDVVRAAAAQCQFDQPVRAGADISDLERIEDRLVADRIGKSVRTQQVAVADAGLTHDQRGLDFVAGQRPHDQRALGMTVCLLGGDPALVDQGLDECVVLGDLGQLSVAQQIAARVADVNQAQPVAGEQDGGQGGAHTLEVGVLLDFLRNRRVALVDGLLQLAEQVTTGLVVVEGCQRRDHQLGRHFAGGMAAHTVGQRE